MNYSEIEMPSNKKFGYFFSGVFLFLTIYTYLKNNLSVSLLFFITMIALLSFTIFFPSKLYRLNKLWFMIGITLGRIVSPIILSGIFFILITPVAIISRCFGRDPLLTKRSNASTYWISRENDESTNFKDQY